MLSRQCHKKRLCYFLFLHGFKKPRSEQFPSCSRGCKRLWQSQNAAVARGLRKGQDLGQWLLLAGFPTCSFRRASPLIASSLLPTNGKLRRNSLFCGARGRGGRGSPLRSPTQLLITRISLAPSSCLVFILAWISAG